MKVEKSKFQWRKIRPSDELKTRLQNAIDKLNSKQSQEFKLISHLFGKLFLLEFGGFLLFKAGTGSRPGNIEVLAINLSDHDILLQPLSSELDFVALLEQLQTNIEITVDELAQIVNPRKKRPSHR